MAKKKKYYVVWAGHKPGVYSSWAECQAQIKAFAGAKYKSFEGLELAVDAFKGKYEDHVQRGVASKKKKVKHASKSTIVWKSMSVDAACGGNPGRMEYQGVDTKTGMQFFHQKFPVGTNNIGEFLAIVHGLAMLEKQEINIPIYSDSRTAMIWVKKKKAKTTLDRNSNTEHLYDLIERAENWLKTHDFRVPLLKWETKDWGEIPADFGRK